MSLLYVIASTAVVTTLSALLTVAIMEVLWRLEGGQSFVGTITHDARKNLLRRP